MFMPLNLYSRPGSRRSCRTGRSENVSLRLRTSEPRWRFPVVEGRFGKIVGAAGGKVLWTVLPIVGAHGRGGHTDLQGRLELFEFATLRTEVLQDKADDFVVAADGATVLLREGKRLRAIPAEKNVEKIGEPQSDAPSRKSASPSG